MICLSHLNFTNLPYENKKGGGEIKIMKNKEICNCKATLIHRKFKKNSMDEWISEKMKFCLV